MGEREISEKALEEIYSNPENVKRIMESKTKDDVKEIFSKKGIELTQERYDFLKKIYSSVAKEIKKMTPEELEKISGGKFDAGGATHYGSIGAASLGGATALLTFLEKLIEGAIKESGGNDSFAEKTKRIFEDAGAKAVGLGTVAALVGGAAGAGLGGYAGDIKTFADNEVKGLMRDAVRNIHY